MGLYNGEQAAFRHEGSIIDYTPGAEVLAGTVVLVGSIVGLANNTIPANRKGALQVDGVWEVAKAAGAISAGDHMYWDDTAKNATSTSAGNTYMGRAELDAADGDATVLIRVENPGTA